VRPLRFSRARFVAAPADVVLGWTITAPVPEVFDRGFGPLPPVVAVDQQGPDLPWGTPGQVRVLRTSDGSSMREELTEVDPGHAFRYRITEVIGPLRTLTHAVAGEYAFTPAPGGCEARWTWMVAPASPVAAAALPVVRLLWYRYADRALERIDAGGRAAAA
jgi:hypothetical protein